jgi:nucleotide-binding universal stress UspA family protein
VYRRILIPIDGSACSDAALAHGLRLAQEQHAEIKVIYVLDTQGGLSHFLPCKGESLV